MILRPEKANFSRRFEGLSRWASGSIFTLSDSHRSGFPLGRFQIYCERTSQSGLRRMIGFFRTLFWRPWRLHRGTAPPDAIIAYDPLACGICGVLLKWLLRAPLVVEVNGDHHEIPPSGNRLKRWVARRALRLSLSRADAIKVLNTSQERYFRALYPGKPIVRFMDFVAEGYFSQLPIEAGDFFLTVGHPFEFKGVGEIIQAFQLIAARHPALHLRIMGWCPEPELARFRALAGDHPRIHFLPPGWVEDVGEQMCRCFVLINASHFEAGGRVIFEAMACRKPVVATRANGPNDYVQDGVTGLLCDIKNPEDLAAKLDRLASDPGEAQAMGAAGYRLLRSTYSEADYVRRYHDLLKAIGVVVPDASMAAP